MLHSIEIEIDAYGHVHSPEPLPAGRRAILTLLDDPTPTIQNSFQDLFGMLKATKGVSLDEMELAISQKAQERFNDCD